MFAIFDERHPGANARVLFRRGERWTYSGGVAGAAFFDLDRTLLRRSSALALAGSFRERGVISRWQLVKSAFWQLLFVLRGASAEAVRTAAEDGMGLLDGFPLAGPRGLVGGAPEPRLPPPGP